MVPQALRDRAVMRPRQPAARLSAAPGPLPRQPRAQPPPAVTPHLQLLFRTPPGTISTQKAHTSVSGDWQVAGSGPEGEPTDGPRWRRCPRPHGWPVCCPQRRCWPPHSPLQVAERPPPRTRRPFPLGCSPHSSSAAERGPVLQEGSPSPAASLAASGWLPAGSGARYTLPD